MIKIDRPVAASYMDFLLVMVSCNVCLGIHSLFGLFYITYHIFTQNKAKATFEIVAQRRYYSAGGVIRMVECLCRIYGELVVKNPLTRNMLRIING
jgi:hypothetical protein